jgi:dsRNA-specific ribonuclease
MKHLSTAKAKAKKEAEQLASKEALKIFGILPDDY